MRKFLTIMMLTGVALAAPAAHPYEVYEVRVAPESGAWTASRGEKVSFGVTLENCNVPADGELEYFISEDMMPARKSGHVKLRKGRATIDAGTMRAPGFLRCEAVYTGPDGRRYSGLGTIGFDPDSIVPATENPADFDTFWEETLRYARECGLNSKMELLPGRCTPTVDVYRVSFSVFHRNSRIYGMLAVPRGKKTMPAVVMYPGAGVHVIGPAIDIAERCGAMTLSIGIHGIPVDLDPEVYRNLDWGALQGYFMHKIHARDQYYYKRVVAAAAVAVDFVASLPECNGCIAAYGGSQGGFLAIASAALNPAVKMLAAHFPALSDHAGYLKGRAGGWPAILRDEWNRTPAIINTLKYYDTVNFARRLSVPGFYTYGYNDLTCPPTSVCAAFNVITAPKKFFVVPTTMHYTFTEQYDWSLAELARELAECSGAVAR